MVLTQQLDGAASATLPRLPLSAAERRVCRGRRYLEDGRAVLLQLPRGQQLIPGCGLADAGGTPQVVVAAAPAVAARERRDRRRPEPPICYV